MAKQPSKRTAGKIVVYAGAELKRLIEQAARKRGLSASTFAAIILRNALRREGRKS